MPTLATHGRTAAPTESAHPGRGRRALVWPPIIAGAVAAAAVTVPPAVLHLSDPVFLLVYLAAAAAAGYGAGRTAGMVAAALCVLSAWYFILPPVRGWALPGLGRLEIVLFALAAAAAAAGGAWMREAVDAQQRIEARLRAGADLMNLTYDALFSWELDGAITFWNRAAEELYGYTREEAVGRVSHDLLRTRHPLGVEHFVDALRRTGRWDGELRHFAKDGREIIVDSRHQLLEHDGRRVVLETNRDVTERRRAERNAGFLAEASAVLGRSLDLDRTLDALAHLAVPALADWCTIDVVAADGAMERVVVAHADPGKTAVARGLRQRWQHTNARAGHGVPHVARTGRAELLSDITDALLQEAFPDPEFRAAVRATGLRSAMIVPLVARDRVLGAMSLVAAESGRRYSRGDLALAEEFGHRAALAFDNARAHDAEQKQRQAAEETARRIIRLQTVTAALSEAVTPQDVAAVVLAQGMGALEAQAGAVYVISPDGASLEMLQHVLYPEDVAQARRRVPLSAPAASAEAARTGEAIYFDSPEAVGARFPQLQGHTHPLPGSRIFVPMIVRGRTLGTLVFIFGGARRFDTADREFIQALSRQCAQALDRARLYAHEHRVAATLQEALLPTALPQLPGIEIDAAYRAGSSAADVGGDWYDAVWLPDGRVMLAIGDVVGRGLEAAVTMGQIRQAIRAGALEGHAPADTLALTAGLLRLAPADQGMTTAIVGVLDPIASTFTYACAGHPAPLLATAGRVELLPAGGMPLGFLEERAAPSHTITLAPGALLVLYTDGLVESRRDPVAGVAALCAVVERQWPEHGQAPAHAILSRAAVTDAVDDIAILAVSLDPAPLERVDLTVPADPESLRPVRQALQRLAKSVALDEARTFALAVAAGEAINNAIEHAYGAARGSVSVRAWRDGQTVKVEIGDQGRWRRERPRSTGGRGLGVIRGLTQGFELATSATGTTVRFAVPLDASDARVERFAPPPAAAAAQRAGADIGANGAETAAPVHAAGLAEVRTIDGMRVIEISGDVDLAAVGRFTRLLDTAAAAGEGPLIVSLPATAYFDSQGIRALFRIARRLEINRRPLVLVVPARSPLRHLLNLVEFGSAFAMFQSVDEALAAFKAGGTA